jgi:hypothetical protein
MLTVLVCSQVIEICEWQGIPHASIRWLGIPYPVTLGKKRFPYKQPVLLSDLKKTWNMSTNFSKKSLVPNFIDIRTAVSRL